MHDLLHTSTSYHFKIYLKSHTTGATARQDPTAAFLGHSFIRRLCIRWNKGSLYNSLTFLREAQGFDGLSVTSLLQFLKQCDLNDYDICFAKVKIGENDVNTVVKS